MGHYVIRSWPRLSQGDIWRDVAVIEGGTRGQPSKRTIYPYAVVLTQDCDLEQDWNAYIRIRELGPGRPEDKSSPEDKLLRHIIFAPCYILEQFKEGEHIYGRKMNRWSLKEMRKIRANDQFSRYHYLCGDEALPLPELIIDFKHYFTVERDTAYSIERKDFYVCSLKSLYREDLSHRFASYLSRIGLPNQDDILRNSSAV